LKFGHVIRESPVRFVFAELTPAWVLKGIVDEMNILPKPDSNSPRALKRSVEGYIERNLGKLESHFCTNFADFVLNSASERDLNAAYKEPTSEAALKPMVRRRLVADGFDVYPREVSIPPNTRADMVAYVRHFDRVERPAEGRFNRMLGRTEIIRRPHYEFLGIELKTAKRSKDPMYRQASVYTDYFDNSFSVITPLTVLRHGYVAINKFIDEMTGKGMGILLANRSNILGTILKSERKEISHKKNQHVLKEIGLSS
jgi:hypothetical protein